MKIENSEFENLFIDLTRRCNLYCANCYNPVNSSPDMTVEYFESVVKKLSSPVRINLIGGEPTLNKDLFEMIDIGKSYGHSVVCVSNGLRYAEQDFIRQCEKHPCIYYMTCDGGSNRDIYKKMNGSDCYETKMKTLYNLLNSTIKHVAIGAIIIRGLNEFVIKEFVDLAKIKKNIKFLKFRTVGKVGRHIETNPYTIPELKSLLHQYIPVSECALKDCNQCGSCYRIIHNGLYISIIEFASAQSAKCNKRGQILDGFNVERFFQHMREKTNDIS